MANTKTPTQISELKTEPFEIESALANTANTMVI